MPRTAFVVNGGIGIPVISSPFYMVFVTDVLDGCASCLWNVNEVNPLHISLYIIFNLKK